MNPLLLILIYSALVVGSSLFGGWLPTHMRLTHTRMQLVLSFVGGLMLGIALLHLLPHGAVMAGSFDVAVISALAGLLVMFFLIRMFHFHEHGPTDFQPAEHDEAASHFHEHAPDHDCDLPGHVHTHDHGHAHGHGHKHDDPAYGAHRYSWFGVVLGLGLHTLIDGVALGAAVVADAAHAHDFPLYGIGVFLAVLLHKPLDALSVTAVMGAGGWTSRTIGWVNLAFALMCPVGALVVYWGFGGGGENMWLGAALGFSAGVFLCISLSDLLPELQFHSHDRLKLSVSLLLGVLVAFGIGLLEPEHAHDMPGGAHAHDHGHDHAHDHDHEHDEAAHDHQHDH